LAALVSTHAFASPEAATNAVQDFHLGMSSNDQQVVRETMAKYLPEESDLVYLFGEKGRLLAKNFKASNLFGRLINDAGSLGQKIQAKGAITSIEVEQVNRQNPRYQTFFDELALVPNEVEVYVPNVEYEKLAGGPFHARVVVLPSKVLLLVGFERFADAAREIEAAPNK